MANVNRLYFTSDWHLGHKNILKFSNRPFDDVEAMRLALIKRYNAIVPSNGICYFLGDMGFGVEAYLNKTLEELNGTKVLILGNHDKGRVAMMERGFDLVLNGAQLYIAGEIVTLTHMPLLGVKREDTSTFKGMENDNFHGESRPNVGQYSTHNHGQFHLHGHIHSPNSGKSERICGRQMDVGVDANNYTPVSYSQVESWIIKTKEKENNEKT